MANDGEEREKKKKIHFCPSEFFMSARICVIELFWTEEQWLSDARFSIHCDAVFSKIDFTVLTIVKDVFR